MNSTFGTSKPQVLTRTTSDNVLDRRGGRIHGTATRGTRNGRTYRVPLLLGWEASDSCTVPAYQSAAWPIFSPLELRSTKNNARFTSLLALAGTHVENPSTAAVAAPSITVKAPKDDTHQMKASARGGGILLIPPRASQQVEAGWNHTGRPVIDTTADDGTLQKGASSHSDFESRSRRIATFKSLCRSLLRCVGLHTNPLFGGRQGRATDETP